MAAGDARSRAVSISGMERRNHVTTGREAAVVFAGPEAVRGDSLRL
jgi:hypothetical protein